MVLPAYSLDPAIISEIKDKTRRMALELDVRGLLNIQYAVKGADIYVLEVNPRASRTVPFISKATGVPLAKVATRIMAGRTLKEQGVTDDPEPGYFSVKESVLPFNRFLGGDILLGPEMKSTGEVMGIDTDLGTAFAKSQIAARQILPLSGKVFISVKDYDKGDIVDIGKRFFDMGFEILSTPGTAQALMEHDIPVTRLTRIDEGRPNLLDYIKNKDIGLLINTPSGPKPRRDEVVIRNAAVSHGIPVVTTISGAVAVIGGIQALRRGPFGIRSLQEIYSA